MAEQIYGLIQQAMQDIGAIGKDSTNAQQKYKFRGIDAVYNALNPVMAKLGLFVCPEILEHRREERETENDYNGQKKKSILKYSILTIKYTVYAPDGSNISCVVVGEGMDSGDKASNKAMSVALKYACFQLFMIPTEEMIDPDAETHNVTSAGKEPKQPKETEQAKQENVKGNQAPPPSFQKQDAPADVTTAPQLPNPDNPVLTYLARERNNLAKARGISPEDNKSLWMKQIACLRANKLLPEKNLSDFTMREAEDMVSKMYNLFTPTGTELKEAVSA